MRSYLAILAFLSCITTVQAGTVDFTQVLRGPDGPFKDCRRNDDAGKCIEYVDLTLGRLCINAAALPDRNASIADQTSHGRLAMRLLDAKEVDLTAEEIKFLKDQIAKLGYNSIVVYQAVKLLDPVAAEK